MDDSEANKKKRLVRACSTCRAKKLTCDEGRPCKRCSSRNLFCTDEKPKKKYSTDDSTLTTVISSKVAKKAGGSLDDDLVTQRSEDLRTTLMQPRMMEDTVVSPLQPHNRTSFAQLVSENLDPFLQYTIQKTHHGNADSYFTACPPIYADVLSLLTSPSEENTRMQTPALYKTIITDEQLDQISKKVMTAWSGDASQSYIVFNSISTTTRKRDDILKFVTPPQMTQMIHDFHHQIENCISVCDFLDVPAMVWDSVGTIYYANRAYLDLTGFPYPLPQKTPEELLMLQVMKPSSAVTNRDKLFRDTMANTLMLNVWKKNKMVLVKRRGDREEFYVDCTMCITHKQDIMGLEVIELAHFLPSPNSLNY
ncbi:transcriptional regulator Regulator of drug sensitivity (RDS2) [Planoprotostelium fungivorum]|uniref:Transcriptional regulator Regulator of drug sensitivity (RDS2) n=1 Tax=Planoprotostelium fungivorum TaxID=1890364 RepID=A0A2P6NUY5_9EUKA|nr:transcriptional regulator Regulator of drug sensitivity (RDS2) [Planoprotostelium fungivorum]